MAKSVPQHRVLIVAPSDNVTTIHEEDEEEQNVSSANRDSSISDSSPYVITLPNGDIIASRIPQSESQESVTDSFYSSCSHTQSNSSDNNLAGHQTSQGTSHTISRDSSQLLTDSTGCKPILSRNSTRSAQMEHDSLLLHGARQCNGQVQARRSQSPPSFFNERRATMTSSDGVDRPRYSGAKNPPSHHTPTNRSLSVSLGSSKEFSVTVGSQDLFPKPTDTLSNTEDAKITNKLDRSTKHQAKYGSTLTNIGVEYMKATGTMGVRFTQLQDPLSKKQDSSGNLSGGGDQASERRSSMVVSNLCNDLPLIIPMNTNSQKPSTLAEVKAKHRSHRSTSHHHAGYRLGQRKALAEQRRRIADYSCLFALIGLLLMIIEMECTIAKFYKKSEIPSYGIKILITLTTVVLLCLIGVYHAIEVRLFVVDNCIEDWRITMSWRRICQIVIELVVCAIHPLPGAYSFKWAILDIKTLAWLVEDVPLDVIFSIPMFMRLYLIIRVMLLHSKLFTDASSRSIGALNKITFNTRFVLKTLMNIFPGTVMVVFMMSLWIVCAWILRACECWHDTLMKNLLNSLYLVAITFLSVGYGDFVPHTYCGRTVCVLSGLMGAGCTALVVAVIAKKLELTRAEKHVHNFMIENQLSKKLKDAAANVLRETWLIYKYTKLVKRVNSTRVRAHQRKFLQAIHDLRTVKIKQRKLADQANSLTDFAKTTTLVLDIVSDMKSSQSGNDSRLDTIEKTMTSIQMQMEALPLTIAQILAEKQSAVTTPITPSEEATPVSVNSESGTLNVRPSRLRYHDGKHKSFDSGP